VTILWEDITGHDGGWQEVEEVQSKMPVKIVTAGLFLSEDEKYLRLASDWSWDGSVHTVNVIPKSVILARRDQNIPMAMWPKPPAKRRRSKAKAAKALASEAGESKPTDLDTNVVPAEPAREGTDVES
jgi:hypothetical protein